MTNLIKIRKIVCLQLSVLGLVISESSFGLVNMFSAFAQSQTTESADLYKLIVVKSDNSPEIVEKKYVEFLQSKGIKIFAVLDHEKAAAGVKQKLPFTRVIVFGNPTLGTTLMMKTPNLALDLPMKTLIRASGLGAELIYRDFAKVLAGHGVQSEPAAIKVAELLEAAAKASTASDTEKTANTIAPHVGKDPKSGPEIK